MIKDNASQMFNGQPLGRILAGIARTFLGLLNSNLSNLDIERNYYALILIDKAKDGITQQDLACQLGTDKVSVVRIIDYLSENGYVQRLLNKDDRRKYCLTLTDKAIKALPQIKKTLVEVTDKALNGLTSEEVEKFYEILSIIKNNLKESNTSI
ncbi:MAG: MarR family transcriptional regulator [Bacteroidota bacterium]|nr:MarR family transcriptional regulator [Bacteroidota bacterium]